MSARDRIFERIRQGHARRAARGHEPTPNPAVKRPVLGDELTALWIEQVGLHFGTAHTLAEGQRVADAVEQIADSGHIIGFDACVASQDWTSKTATFERAEAPKDRPIFVTAAHAAVAETGSVLMSGGTNRKLINAYLVRHLIVLVSEATMVGTLEEAAERIPEINERQVILMTGPSATGDIGGELILGAQAADRLDYLLIP